MTLTSRTRDALVLGLFAVVFVGLAVGQYTRTSATWDEPQHLVAGYTAARLHDYRTDLEHPPGLRMWAALPLLAMPDVRLDLTRPAWRELESWNFCHEFLYQDNDADRLLYRARFMIVLLGVVLGGLLFAWARELFGFTAAVLSLGVFVLEPNLLAHASLVTTDFGVVCFLFGALYFAWRTTRRLSPANVAGLAIFVALAHVSKFTALLLGPVLLLLFGWQALRAGDWPWWLGRSGRLRSRLWKGVVAGLLASGVAAATIAAIWAVYSFRYLPHADGPMQYPFSQVPEIQRQVPRLAAMVDWVDGHRLLPQAYTQGFLLGQANSQVRGGFLAGSYSRTGWWYYFPVVFLIKTPVTVLWLFFAGLVVVGVRWRELQGAGPFLLVLPAVYFLVVLTSRVNIGVRHLLPVYPFVLLVATAALTELGRRRQRVVLAGLAALLLVEFGLVYPHPIASFNLLVGGPRYGHQWLVDSNLDWGQDLKGLKRWMERQGVDRLNLSYFGTADPAYYGIHCVYLPGGPTFAKGQERSPVLPGYVAVSATNLRGVYADERRRAFYWPLLEREPVAVIGHSLFVYWVEQPWWKQP